MSATQQRFGAPAANCRSSRSSATRTPGTRTVVALYFLVISPQARRAADALTVLEDQVRPDPRRPVDLAALVVQLTDPGCQASVLRGARRWWPPGPGVISRT